MSLSSLFSSFTSVIYADAPAEKPEEEVEEAQEEEEEEEPEDVSLILTSLTLVLE